MLRVSTLAWLLGASLCYACEGVIRGQRKDFIINHKQGHDGNSTCYYQTIEYITLRLSITLYIIIYCTVWYNDMT